MKTQVKNMSFEKQQCIWMSNGILEYKLCDRNFECENCHIDMGMRHSGLTEDVDKNSPGFQQMEPDVYIQHLLHRLNGIHYSQNFLNLKNQITARNIFDTSFYIGLNPIVNMLLDKETEVNLINNNQTISAGDEFLCLNGSWGRLIIDSPISFRMLGKITDSGITQNNWICLAEIEQKDFTDSIFSEHSFKRMKNEISRIFNQKDLSSVVGQTMNDGGVYLTKISDILGHEDFQVVLKKLFPDSKL